MILGILVYFALAIVYYGIAIYGIHLAGLTTYVTRIPLIEWIRILVVLIISTVFITLEAKTQQTIYIWDSLQVWFPAVYCGQEILSHPLELIRELYDSINHNEKNNFLPMLMSIPLQMTGFEFTSFVAWGWIMFSAPAALFTSLGTNMCLRFMGKSEVPYSLLFAVVLLIPACYIPVLSGYMNVAILLTGATLWILCLSLNPEKMEYRKLLALSACSILAVIETRTAAYMVIGCFAGMSVSILWQGYSNNKKSEYLFVLCKKFAFVGTLSISILAIFFKKFLFHSLVYDIKTAYSAYSFGQDFGMKLYVAGEQLGFIFLLIMFISLIYGLTHKSSRYIALFLGVWIFGSILLFCRIQMMGMQHFYIAIIPLAAIFLLASSLSCDTGIKKFVGGTTILLLSINFLLFFFHEYHSPIRYDLNEISNISHDLYKTASSTHEKIYILSSSAELNPDTFSKIDFPQIGELLPLANSSHVDLRDGFPLDFLDTNIIVVADPIQTHLLPKDQSVVVLLADSMLHDSPISRHFQLVKSYYLHHDRIPAIQDDRTSGEVAIHVYRKASPFQQEDIDYLKKLFDENYSDYPDLFRNRLNDYKKSHF